MSPSLNPAEIDRYKRHLVLHEVGGPGQQKLKAAKVLVVGAGGLGSPLLMYLAAAGVGVLGIIDADVVSLDNLQRQIIHTTATIGQPKVDSAQAMIERLNPHCAVVTHQMRLDHDNAQLIIGQYDFVADGSDNFATRYLVSDACYFAGKTLIFGAVGPYDGYVTTFKPHEPRPRTSQDQSSSGFQQAPSAAHNGKWPTYRCLFPEPPAAGTVPNCAEVGVLGVTVGVIGTLQASEVVKEIVQFGESLAGRLLIYDARTTRFREISVPWSADNPLTGTTPSIFDLSMHGSTTKTYTVEQK